MLIRLIMKLIYMRKKKIELYQSKISTLRIFEGYFLRTACVATATLLK